MPASPAYASRIAMLAAAAATVLSVSPAVAQASDPPGPGQDVPPPPAQCPQVLACTYTERNYLPNSYRFQMLRVCGANCTSQYWVSSIPEGQLLVAIEPVRGGGIVAIGRAADPQEAHPPIRTVLPDFAPKDPACCPSQYADTTYVWDPASATLAAGDPTLVPAGEFDGWESVRARLESEGFFEVFRGL
jgi:hypothetical protein